jgi:tetratricopeptide (TPR) repeat protein
MRKTIMTVLAALAATELMAIQGTISTETDSTTGDIKWQSRAKTYMLTYKKGKTDLQREYTLAEVVSLDIPKPAGYDKAVAMVEGGQGAQAIGNLTKIVADYRMLVWDKPAGRYLALAYIAANQPQKAYDVCQEIIRENKEAAWSGDLAAAYWQSLLKLGKMNQLEPLLKKAATSGDRQASAAALNLRGDIIVATGNGSADTLKSALRDGYLRVALMYTDADCTRERAEGMMKAAQCFEQLGQAARAERLRAQAKEL